MDNNHLSDNSSLLGRREILKAGALGITAVGFAGLAPLADAFQDNAMPNPSGTQDRRMGDGTDPRTRARNESEWRTNLSQLGTLSLMASEMALTKAVDPDVKEFANFEFTEQSAVAVILKDNGTKVPADLDATSRAALREHEAAAPGVAFDKVYSTAQLATHQKLLILMESLLQNSKSNSPKEREARHLATLSIAAIKEHIAHSQKLVNKLGA